MAVTARSVAGEHSLSTHHRTLGGNNWHVSAALGRMWSSFKGVDVHCRPVRRGGGREDAAGQPTIDHRPAVKLADQRNRNRPARLAINRSPPNC
uniref:Uncharacterized protein n=1 Tax=Plectus sambesii TaxID=2011161 RepID=A0A914X5M2_9BILA